jgi:hypothetical protein
VLLSISYGPAVECEYRLYVFCRGCMCFVKAVCVLYRLYVFLIFTCLLVQFRISLF